MNRLPASAMIPTRSIPDSYATSALAHMLLLLGLLASAGCSKDPPQQPASPTLTALERMRQAMDAGQWQQAWEVSADVLIEQPDDPDVLSLVARVAFETRQQTVATDLLLEACRVEDYRQPSRVQQAFTVLVSAGRLFDGIDLLRQAVERSPDSGELRRLLFDFLVGTEQHAEAGHHGRTLVQQRKFDIELLLALERPERRTTESDSLVKMTQRHANDLRPLIGLAKKQLDRQSHQESIETLQSILGKHPQFSIAQVMLGRTLVLSGRFSDLSSWAEALSGDCRDHADYWLTLGDWAVWLGNAAWSAEAYAKAARLEVDSVEPWRKLTASIQSGSMSQADMAAIQSRSSMLTQLRQLRAEFSRSDRQSKHEIHQIADLLVELGRPWEAEAWCAIGLTTTSQAGRSQLESLRARIVRRLTRQTPWQLPDKLPGWDDLDTEEATPLLARLSGKLPSEPATADRLRLSAQVVPMLVDEAEDRGLVFFGRTADDLDQPGIRIHETLGCGGGTVDFDRDGWPDLYLVAAGGQPPNDDSQSNALYRNLRGRFARVPAACSGDDRGFAQGVAVGDVNEDGFDDLLVLNYGPNRIWINNGDGTFSDRSDRWLPPSSAWSTSGAIADVDADGISDVIIVNYCAGLEPAIEDCEGPDGGAPRACSPIHFPAAPDVFLKGTPGGHFADVTASWNARPELLGRGLGIVAGALDQRPGIDVLVVNDMTSNHLWTRESSQPFQLSETAPVMGLAGDGQARPQGSMGVAIADIDLDGLIDFYVTNFENEYNTLHLRHAQTVWRDATAESGLAEVTMPMVGFGTEAIDFDNDSVHELVVANGHVDFFEKGERKSPYYQPAQLFQRTPAGRFRSVASRIDSPYFRELHCGRALWTIDADRDGQMDVVVSHQTEPIALLVNHTASENHWLGIELVATNGARTAVGSLVTARLAGEERVAMLSSGDGYQCSNERCIHFGLGDTNEHVDVTIVWPDGRRQTVNRLVPDKRWLVVQDQPPFELSKAVDEIIR